MNMKNQTCLESAIDKKTLTALVDNIVSTKCEDFRQIDLVKNLCVTCKEYELAATIREHELSIINRIRETEEFKNAHNLRVALNMLEINTDLKTCSRIAKLVAFAVKRKSLNKFTLMDAAKINSEGLLFINKAEYPANVQKEEV